MDLEGNCVGKCGRVCTTSVIVRMRAVAASDTTLDLSKHDHSRGAAHAACLRATPFCSENESLADGVQRLGAWLTASLELKQNYLNQVIVVVLASFWVGGTGRIASVRDLNDAWVQITRDVFGPLPPKLEKSYLLNARMIALCTLCKYMPERYGERLVNVRTAGIARDTRVLVNEIRSQVLAEWTMRRVVGKLVETAVSNVLRGAREEAVLQHRRSKKLRRRLARVSIGVAGVLQRAPSPVPPSIPPTPPSPQALPTLAIVTAPPMQRGSTTCNTAAHECVVCLGELSSKRPLLACGHARYCSTCAYSLHECPLCRKAVGVVMEIFV